LREIEVEAMLVGLASACVADLFGLLQMVLRQRSGWVSWASWNIPKGIIPLEHLGFTGKIHPTYSRIQHWRDEQIKDFP
jgi:hypothetical protein